MNLDDLQVYQRAMGLGERIWNQVEKWQYFERDTIGKQLMRSVDSIAANLNEGFGRYFFKENKQFCYYSRGSLYETNTWWTKAFNRGLLTQEIYNELYVEIEILSKMLNKYISSIGHTK